MGQHNRQKHPMPRKQWERMKLIDVGPGRYIHVSAAVQMRPVPFGAGIQYAPWVQKPGETYNVGRNKAKRARRELKAFEKKFVVAA